MIPSVTHFEIYGEEPARLADFYRNVFGWEIDQMPGINYWRVQTGSTETNPLHGGITFRAIADLNGWMLFVNVSSLDETVALVQKLGGSIVRPKTAVPRTAWVTIVAGVKFILPHDEGDSVVASAPAKHLST